jgi:hypothetical protein
MISNGSFAVTRNDGLEARPGHLRSAFDLPPPID